jgi:hypothetical protein
MQRKQHNSGIDFHVKRLNQCFELPGSSETSLPGAKFHLRSFMAEKAV